MNSAISATLLAAWALALLAAGEVCHPNKPIENEDFRISCATRKPPGVVTLLCKSEAERWSNFPKERMNLTGFDVEIEECGFPDNGDFRLLGYIDSLGLREIGLLKFTFLKTSLAPNLLSGMSVFTLEFYDSTLITEFPGQLLHGMRIGGRFWATNTNLTKVPPDFFLNQGNITYVDLNFNEIEKLSRTVFEPLVKLKRLSLAANRLTEIEDGLFDRLTELENLDISTNLLKTLPPNIFYNLKSLSTLHLGVNQFNEFPADLLINQKEHLTSFKMNINRGIMNTVPSSFFKNHRKLENVELMDNQFTSLPADLFAGTEVLKSVNFFKNNFTELPSRIFADAPNLKKLSLSNNQLSELPDDIFSENANLEELYLDNNRLTNITDVLSGLNHLRLLDVSYNLLVDINLKICDGNINYNLQSIDISYNNLIAYGAFINCVGIQTINISNNNITKIISFDLINKIQLDNFNLANNRITELPLSAISQLPVMHSLSFLNVSGNLISSINMTNLFEPDSSTRLIVDLSRNPLYCDCYNYDFLSFLESARWRTEISHFTLITKNLTCVGPPEFAGQNIVEVDSTDLTCLLVSNETDNACTELCTCYENPGKQRLIVDCSNRKLKSVPEVILNEQNWSIALNMSGNDLQLTPAMNGSYRSVVVALDLSSNNISTVTLDVFSESLRELQLHNNSITKLEPKVIEYLTEDTQLKNLTLYNNNWVCDCQARDFLKFVRRKLADFQLDKVKCNGINKLLSTMTADELCENTITIIVGATIVIVIAFISIAVAVLAALYYKYQKEIKIWLYSKQLCLWFVTENELDKDKKYDAFISFSHKDEEFVVNEIINKLEEGPNPYKLCVHYRDWLAGEWITEQIARSVEESRRTIVVLSPNFLESIWGGMEFRTAHNKALKEGRVRVILILYGDIGNVNDLDPELKAYLSMNTYVKWGDPWFWDKLRYALPHKHEPSKRKTRNARIIENHLAQMGVHAHDSNDKAEIIPMPNISTTTHDSAKLLDSRSEENRTVGKF